jgi:tetratricopeptide (TPR) repeat protein
MTIEQLFESGLTHHQAGRLVEASAIYRQVLQQQPDHAEALHLLGLLAAQSERPDIAVGLIRRAIALRPNFAEAQINLGNALRANGQLDEAIAAYRHAIVLRPNYAGIHSNLSDALREKGQFDDAIAACRQAIGLDPNLPEAHNNLGNALRDKGELDAAIAAYRLAISLRPNYAEAYSNLGNALKDTGQLEDAIAAYRQAITLRPDYAQAHNNLGAALAYQGQLDAAIASCHKAIALAPKFADAHNNLGTALADEGQLNEAIASYRQSIVLAPNVPEAHYNLSFALLARGDFQEGWEEHEWRWKCKHFTSPLRNFTQPQWDGEPLEGRTLLLHSEQGFGDALQFIRYVPMAAQRGGRIIVECPPELQRLFQTLPGEYQVVARGQTLPAFDLHCPLLSLPLIFGTTLTNIPKIVPYLQADADASRKWKQRTAACSPGVKVGLAWAGSPGQKNNRNRSTRLAKFAPLAQMEGMRLFSVQKGSAAAESKTPPRGMELIDWTEELTDFAETAALIANLDLVIAVDTAIAHLAGAMGKPVWTLLSFVPDWRWLMERDDCPWYPSMRLFRQPFLGDWESITGRVVDELTVWIKSRD